MAPPSTLKDKVAWITGGGSGIGLAGAQALKDAGATVVISGRSEKDARSTRDWRRSRSTSATRRRWRKVAATILERHGRIDILVNSAGINHPKRRYRDVSIEGWDQIVAINLSGTFYCCQAVLPGMRERKDGLIINVSSWFGRYWNTLGGPGYNATKHAVVSLTETINVEEARQRHPRHLHPAGRGGDADPREAPGAAAAARARAHAAGRGPRQDHPVPRHAARRAPASTSS